jgi:N-acyl-D-amino-acid deacylase
LLDVRLTTGGSGLDFDLVIRGGKVIDGTGGPGFVADVAVRGDRIAAVGDVSVRSAQTVIDAAGKAVAPGFIDVHTHDDRALLSTPEMAMKVSQGVTTVVVGNCGVSLAPLRLEGPPPAPFDLLGDRDAFCYPTFAAYLDDLDRQPPATNAACLIGHSTLRVGVMDRLDRPATEAEIAAMGQRLDEALAAGVIGLSTGLGYPPAEAAPTAEIVALAQRLKPAGALHTTHMRDESAQVLESLDESFAIGREADVPVIISHHKTAGRANFGRSRETLKKIDRAMAMQPIGLDAYPYVAASTVLHSSFVDMSERILVTWSKGAPEQTGRDLADIVRDWNVTEAEAVARLSPAGAIYFSMDEEDVRRILSFPHTMIGSDGLPHDTHPHPRLWGTFPRVLGHYCREVGLFPLEEAVRRMTGLPATRFGLTGRGRLEAGAHADIVLFDPASVIDRATFEAPTTPAAGIDLVLVNGLPVWRDGAATGARPGRALRRQALQAEARRVA